MSTKRIIKQDKHVAELFARWERLLDEVRDHHPDAVREHAKAYYRLRMLANGIVWLDDAAINEKVLIPVAEEFPELGIADLLTAYVARAERSPIAVMFDVLPEAYKFARRVCAENSRWYQIFDRQGLWCIADNRFVYTYRGKIYDSEITLPALTPEQMERYLALLNDPMPKLPYY